MGVDVRTTGGDPEDSLDVEGQDTGRLDSLLREVARLPEVTPPAPEPERIGTRMAHFQIRAKLGQGGMGIVYGAEDLKLRRKVALKVLPAALVTDHGRRRRFLREARTASAVLHPNLAAIFEIGESEGTVFIAMEHVEGVTLRRLLEVRGGLLDPREAQRIAREIARGVGKAHARGVVHRDLKPENVMVSIDGAVKVLDFGLAKLADGSDVQADGDTAPEEADDIASRLGKVVGTPGYMSPEQARGAAVDARSDVFSVGVMLYEMLSGKRPFRGGTSRELLRAIEHDTPRPVREVAPSVPGSLAQALHRCLQKLPEERYPDCGALGLALEEADVPIASGSRRWVRGLAVGLGLAPVIAIGTWSAWGSFRQQPPHVQAAVVAATSPEDAASRVPAVDASHGSSGSAEASSPAPPASTTADTKTKPSQRDRARGGPLPPKRAPVPSNAPAPAATGVSVGAPSAVASSSVEAIFGVGMGF
jgi:eukaryotic-like serine/threonine-protein kinase